MSAKIVCSLTFGLMIVLLARSASAQIVVYKSNFAQSINSGGSHGVNVLWSTDGTPSIYVTKLQTRQETIKGGSSTVFLGRFAQQPVHLKLTNLPVHYAAIISVYVYLIGSWDGNGDDTKNGGPDIWSLNVNTDTLLYTTFSNTSNHQSYPCYYDQYDPNQISHAPKFASDIVNPLPNLGGGNGSAAYQLKFKVLHSQDSIEFSFVSKNIFSSPQNDTTADEMWGIDSVTVTIDSGKAAFESVVGTPCQSIIQAIAPNPAKGHIQVQFAEGLSGLRYEIVDDLGRKLDFGNGYGERLTLSTQYFSAGLYTFRAEANGLVESRRFIVAK